MKYDDLVYRIKRRIDDLNFLINSSDNHYVNELSLYAWKYSRNELIIILDMINKLN